MIFLKYKKIMEVAQEHMEVQEEAVPPESKTQFI